MTSTVPASMGGPLSDAERAGANYKRRPVADGGPIRDDRLDEIREEAGYANVTVDADELLWLLNERDRLESDNEELSIKWAGLSEERIRRENAEKALRVLEGQLATAQRLLDEQRGATRVAAAAADRFRDVLSEALGHADENPGDDVLVTELREHFGFSGPEPTRWRDFLTGARAQIDQIEADRSALGLDGGDPDER